MGGQEHLAEDLFEKYKGEKEFLDLHFVKWLETWNSKVLTQSGGITRSRQSDNITHSQDLRSDD